MGDSQHPIDTATEGIWVLDDTGKCLEHLSEEQLTQSSRELDDSISLHHPSTQTIAEYLAHLSPTQKKIYNDLRGLGWEDASIHNLLTLLENTRKHHCARLRMRGTSEAEIEQLCTLCDQGITNYSSLSRPLATPADEDYQVQLYLLDEVPCQKRVMLGEK